MIPNPPPAPDAETDSRWLSQSTGFQLLTEDYGKDPQDVVAGWLQQHLGAAADMVGPPDTSANTLLSAASQLSTPGLYGLGEPTLSHLDEVPGFTRILTESGLWAKMQSVQRYVFGIGNWALAFSIEEGALVVRHAYPWRLYTRTDPTDLSRCLEIRELRLCRVMPGSEEQAWFWWCYRIDGVPALSVLDAEGLPCSNLHLQMGDGWAPPEGLIGDAYPFRLKSGRPFLPFQIYSDEDCGTLWNLSGRRGARVGCLNSIALSTFALRCAFGAAVPPMFGINLVKPSGNTRGLQAGTQQGDPSASESIPVVPGTVLFLSEMADSKGSPQMIVPQMGGNLQALQQYVDAYSQGQMSRLGVAGDQVQRNTSNPTSAGALAISQSAKRMKAAMVAPMFRRCDLEAIRKIAALLRLEGIGEYPEDGWSIAYQQIPLTPEEQAAQRDQELHDKDLGLLSTVDLYLSRHPGMERADAIQALRRIREEEAALEADEPTEEEPAASATDGEMTAETAGQMPVEDDTSEEIEDEAVAEVQEELQAILDALSYEEGETDLPAIRASVENIKESLAKIHA